MNIKMFIEFPGILILIGVILLIAAIVVGIIAYKHPEDELVNEEVEEKEKLNDLEVKSEEKEVIEEIQKPTELEEPVLEETKIEEAADYFAEKAEESKEEFDEPEEVVVEELKEEKPNIYGGNVPLNDFNFNTSNEHKVYGEPVKEEDDVELL